MKNTNIRNKVGKIAEGELQQTKSLNIVKNIFPSVNQLEKHSSF